MSSTLHFSLIRDPKLLDIIDEEWEADVLPEEGDKFSLEPILVD